MTRGEKKWNIGKMGITAPHFVFELPVSEYQLSFPIEVVIRLSSEKLKLPQNEFYFKF